ncbi:hypothetical protein SAMN05443270_3114 [Lacrimispora sphenoides]|uniref:hypothetical protein n=1 Tax=Lacrimispora sphenoides TaxID=29370 RepID=UPI0008B9FC5E|nr:hypothetical protein [Lacrimispora sphenoides]SEU09644.1 hypothetical protein SAMN05443270_3114 [Lacrimispora sphenoides]
MINYLVSHKDLVTLTIAILSLFLSISQIIYTALRKLTRFSIDIQNYEFSDISLRDEYTFLLCIINHSTSPFAITRISIVTSDKEYPCYVNHKWIGERYYPKFPESDIPRTERFFSENLPIQLTGNQCFIGFISFPIERGVTIFDENNRIKLKFTTNKGQKTLVAKCPEESKGSIIV